MDDRSTDAAWRYTLGLLERVSSVGYKRGTTSCKHGVENDSRLPGVKADRACTATAARIEIIEQHSSVLITVSYRDATAGCYAEQYWKLTTARGHGICALSGARIRRGDQVYRPIRRRHVPFNASWMVLASAIPEVNRQNPVLTE